MAVPDDELERSEVEAVLETRRELGLRYDAELVDGFAERIERAVDKRVADQLAERQRGTSAQSAAEKRQLALAIISVVAFIPLGIPLGVNGEPFALLIILAAVVMVNLAHAALSKRR